MSRRVIKALDSAVRPLFFPNPLIEHRYKVIPPPPVPRHIIQPAYTTDIQPTFGIYQGQPVKHSPEAIKKLRKSAKVASNTLAATEKFIKQQFSNGCSLTQEGIDKFVFNHIIGQEAYPTPIGFMGFPKSVCVSVNECLVHGIPSLRPLQKGDKINIDVTVFIDGYHGDNNLTVLFGPARNKQIQDVVTLTQKALYQAIKICKPGAQFNQIGYILQKFAEKYGLNVCEDFSGHGVGHLLHLPPMVIHKYYPQMKDIMKPGNIFTIEPIFTLYATDNNMHMWEDNFTIVSPNNPNAQFQHMILITEDGCEVLTQRQDQKIF